MKKRLLVLAISLLFFCVSQSQNTSNIGIGQWRDHLGYYYTHGVSKVENKVFLFLASQLYFIMTPKLTRNTEKLFQSEWSVRCRRIGVTAYDSTSKYNYHHLRQLKY
jgi:hypothetical protein